MEVAKRIPNPNPQERAKGRETLYDSWVKNFPSSDWPRPDINIPGGGSDMAPFLNYAGVPVVDFSFVNATNWDTYPLYHTLYETPFLNDHLLDTDGFAIHKATGQYWAELARVFVDEVVIPMNSTELAVMLLKEYLPALKAAIIPLHFYQEAIEPAKDQLAQLVAVSQVVLGQDETNKFPGILSNFEKVREDDGLHEIYFLPESLRYEGGQRGQREDHEVGVSLYLRQSVQCRPLFHQSPGSAGSCSLSPCFVLCL